MLQFNVRKTNILVRNSNIYFKIMSNSLSISERIKELRKKKDLSQDQFADIIGAKRNNIAQWEAGNNNPSLEYLTSICEHFGVTADWVLFGITAQQETSASPLTQVGDSLIELADHIKKLGISLKTGGDYRPGNPTQNHKADNPGNERKEADQMTEAERKVASLREQGEAVLKQNRSRVKAGSGGS